MNPKALDKRRIERVNLQFQGTMEAVDETGKKVAAPVITRNINAYGVYLMAESAPEMHQEVRLRLNWFGEFEKNRKIMSVSGRVVRIEDLPDRKFGVAVQFNDGPSLFDI